MYKFVNKQCRSSICSIEEEIVGKWSIHFFFEGFPHLAMHLTSPVHRAERKKVNKKAKDEKAVWYLVRFASVTIVSNRLPWIEGMRSFRVPFFLFDFFSPQPNRFVSRLSTCDLSVMKSPVSPVGCGTSYTQKRIQSICKIRLSHHTMTIG